MTNEPTAIYLRISDDREGRELGVSRQYDGLLAAAERDGDVIVGPDRIIEGRRVRAYVDNDLSASTRSRKRRPDYERMLADARAGIVRKVRAYSTSRITRRPREFEDLIDLAEQHGVTYRYIRSPDFNLNTADGREHARYAAARDAGEAERIGERVADKKAQQRARGEWTGGRRPFGFEADGVTPRAVEFDAITDATRRVLAGETCRSIWRGWNERGLTTATGTPWDGSKFRQMLVRPRNAGRVGKLPRDVRDVRAALNKLPTAVWRAPLDTETFVAVAGKLLDPSRRTNEGVSQTLVGSFLYFCGCEPCRKVGRRVRSGGLGSNGQPRYTCPDMRLVRTADPVDKMVRAQAALILNREGVKLLAPAGDAQPLRDRLVALRARADEIAAVFGDPDGDMSADQFKIANAGVQKAIKETEAELARLTAGSVFEGVADAPEPGTVFLGLEVDRQRAIIDALMTVTLTKVGRGRRGFDPNSVEIEPK